MKYWNEQLLQFLNIFKPKPFPNHPYTYNDIEKCISVGFFLFCFDGMSRTVHHCTGRAQETNNTIMD